ncbi:hypothetical protein AB839_13215 [Stenotrophomonas sp. DDT-1]|nr:hypothetical protein AB839_13215 [Stenotrophomonas sp. DDT-1]
MTNMDIGSPPARERALRSITPETAKQHELLLRAIFREEIDYRQRDEDQAYFENLYWCAYLLFHVGDLADVESMWIAKNLNMDTGSGFDVENMVGAGVEQTIEYLLERSLDDAADYIDECLPAHSQQEIEEWSRSRRSYFYDV